MVINLFTSTKKRYSGCTKKIAYKKMILLIRIRLNCDASADLSPTNEPPMSFDSAAESNFLAHAGANRRGQPDLGQISLDSHHSAASGQGTDVDHEDLGLAQLAHFGSLLVSFHPHSKQTTE